MSLGQLRLRRVAIQEGYFGAPSLYEAWPAEACYHEYELEGTWTGTVENSSSVSTSSEGLFSITYSCTKDGTATTRSMTLAIGFGCVEMSRAWLNTQLRTHLMVLDQTRQSDQYGTREVLSNSNQIMPCSPIAVEYWEAIAW